MIGYRFYWQDPKGVIGTGDISPIHFGLSATYSDRTIVAATSLAEAEQKIITKYPRYFRDEHDDFLYFYQEVFAQEVASIRAFTPPKPKVKATHLAVSKITGVSYYVVKPKQAYPESAEPLEGMFVPVGKGVDPSDLQDPLSGHFYQDDTIITELPA